MNQINRKITSLKVGTVEIKVNNISLIKNFYTSVLGLEILSESTKSITLGQNKTPLLIVHQREDLAQAHPSEAGLYHIAMLYSSRASLARTIEHILKHAPQHFSGTGDHLVSEAFYFYDPEGNGIELYFDRDRTEWQWENGQIKMAALYIDPVKYIQSNLVIDDGKTEIAMGHIHLRVGDINKAKQFYVDALGFDVTAELPGALFVSIGGYHHHIGMNTWESLAAVERYDSLGLHSFELIIPQKEEIDSLKIRLENNNVKYNEIDGYILFYDPWKNQIKIKSEQK
ncbi:MAG: VOC family protein [bacterium]|nr:VOC family protein [bacterium]